LNAAKKSLGGFRVGRLSTNGRKKMAVQIDLVSLRGGGIKSARWINAPQATSLRSVWKRVVFQGRQSKPPWV